MNIKFLAYTQGMLNKIVPSPLRSHHMEDPQTITALASGTNKRIQTTLLRLLPNGSSDLGLLTATWVYQLPPLIAGASNAVSAPPFRRRTRSKDTLPEIQMIKAFLHLMEAEFLMSPSTVFQLVIKRSHHSAPPVCQTNGAFSLQP